mmetsp:Transcript_33769/g.97032  ORF Transcript_33769/g.97032 Transcript_33769/m.97032 type:complete len:302 (-) Transcript_33769:343-1248(-)
MTQTALTKRARCPTLGREDVHEEAPAQDVAKFGRICGPETASTNSLKRLSASDKATDLCTSSPRAFADMSDVGEEGAGKLLPQLWLATMRSWNASAAICESWAITRERALPLRSTSGGRTNDPLAKRSGSFATAFSIASICLFKRSRFPLQGRTRTDSGCSATMWQNRQEAPNLQPAFDRAKAQGRQSPVAWPCEPMESDATSSLLPAVAASTAGAAPPGCGWARSIKRMNCAEEMTGCASKKPVSATKNPAPGLAAIPANAAWPELPVVPEAGVVSLKELLGDDACGKVRDAERQLEGMV